MRVCKACSCLIGDFFFLYFKAPKHIKWLIDTFLKWLIEEATPT